MNSRSISDTIKEEITINASAERVFEALVNPEKRMQWWGHGAWRVTRSESDLRLGGKWELHVEGDGRTTCARGEYRTIERPHLLVFTWLPDWYEDATESLVRIDLAENAGATTIRLTHSGLATQAARAGTARWPNVLTSLRTHVEASTLDTGFESTQFCEASTNVVFKALTTPSGLASWWMPVSGSGLEGGELRFLVDDDLLVMRVDAAERPSRVTWSVLDAFEPFKEWVGTTISFHICPTEGGGSRLHFRHAGLTPRLACFNICKKGWEQYLPSLVDYVDSGAGRPVGSSSA